MHRQMSHQFVNFFIVTLNKNKIDMGDWSFGMVSDF